MNFNNFNVVHSCLYLLHQRLISLIIKRITVKFGLYDMVGQPTLCRITTYVVVNKQVNVGIFPTWTASIINDKYNIESFIAHYPLALSFVQ